MDYRTLLVTIHNEGPVMSTGDLIKLADALHGMVVADNVQKSSGPPNHEQLVTAALYNSKVMAYMRAGKKINAIKELRAETGAGLKESKEALEDARVHQYYDLDKKINDEINKAANDPFNTGPF